MPSFLTNALGLQKKGLIEITVDNAHYMPGDAVTGHVKIDVHEEIECQG